MADIFISYRRDGGDMTAMHIYQALKERGYDLFYDVEVLRSGKFNEALLKQIQSCKDFIIVLSPHALDRCEDENDWVRQEIAEAIKEKKNIVPVMMNGFQFPENLPEDINELRFHTGLTSSTEYFQESINRLCDKFLTAKPRKKGKWIVPAIVGAVLCALVIGILVKPGTKPSQKESDSSASVAVNEPAESPASDSAHVITVRIPVMLEEMEAISIMSDDWLFKMPYESGWDLAYVDGVDLDARIENNQFYISKFPRQEGITEYKATRYGTDYSVILDAVVPAPMPEDAVLLVNGERIDELKAGTGEKIDIRCYFLPEDWKFLDQDQIADIWVEGENGAVDAEGFLQVYREDPNGTHLTMAVTEPGNYNIGVKVNSGTVVAYRFFELTVE